MSLSLRWRRQNRACALLYRAQLRWRAHIEIGVHVRKSFILEGATWWDTAKGTNAAVAGESRARIRRCPDRPRRHQRVPDLPRIRPEPFRRVPEAPRRAQRRLVRPTRVFTRRRSRGGITRRKVSWFRVLYSLRIRESLSVNRDSPKWGRGAQGSHVDPVWQPAEASQRCPCLS